MRDHAAAPATHRPEENAGQNGAAADPTDIGLHAVIAALPGPTAVFAADPPHFTLLAASDALLATAGRAREDLVGRPLAEAFPDPQPATGETSGGPAGGPGSPAESGLARLRASLEAAVRTGAPQRMARQRYDLQRPDGTWEVRHWDALNTPVRGVAGAVGAVLHQTDDVTERVHTERAAAQAEVRAARVLERMRDAHVTLDGEFRILYVNAAAERALGKARGEMLGRTHWDVFPASVDTDAGRAYRRVVVEGIEQHVTQHYVGEGYDRHLEIDAYPTDEGGVAIFWRDVTARVRAEADVARFQRLVEHSNDAQYLIDEQGRIRWANRLASERTGYAPGELTRLTVGDLNPLISTQAFADYFARARAGRAAPFESIHRHKDGTTFPVEITPTVADLPEGPRMLAAVRDVSERKRAEAALRESEQRFRLMADAVPQIVWMTDPDGRVEFFNQQWTHYTGVPYEPTTAAAVAANFVHPDDGPATVAAFDAARRTGGTFTVEHRIRSAAGDYRWFLVRAEPYRDPATGRTVRWFGASVDIHDRKRAEHELERARAEAEAARAAAEAAQDRAEHARQEAAAANEAKSAFLATMSHELRTPVNAVLGYAQLLDLGLAGPVTEHQHDYLGRLARSSHHLLGLVNDVLDLSKIEAGATRVARADGVTGPAVGAALDVVAPAASARGVRLVDARPDEAGVPFVGDEDRVRQVAVNLLSNAVKFTPPGGTVTVTCETVRSAPPAATHLRGEGPWALVRIVDTGVGIAPEEQGRIFEPFVQVEGGHTRTAGGTGLGLAISRRLARLMGGDLSVESVPGVGSAFTLWLPAARHEAGQPDETAAERSVRAERELTRLETPGLGEVGALLHEAVTEVIGAYTDRLRADPAVPRGAAMTRVQLEDHAISFVADLAQSLMIVEDAGPEAVELLKDGSAIQRAIAEAHGARRYAQGWDESALRRDQQVFREEVERAVRARLKAGSGDVDQAVRVLLRLIDRGEEVAVGAWRRATSAPQ